MESSKVRNDPRNSRKNQKPKKMPHHLSMQGLPDIYPITNNLFTGTSVKTDRIETKARPGFGGTRKDENGEISTTGDLRNRTGYDIRQGNLYMQIS